MCPYLLPSHVSLSGFHIATHHACGVASASSFLLFSLLSLESQYIFELVTHISFNHLLTKAQHQPQISHSLYQLMKSPSQDINCSEEVTV
jgi:hypothetical protein